MVQSDSAPSVLVRPGEHVSALDIATYDSPRDLAFNLSWRSGLRRRSWSYRLL